MPDTPEASLHDAIQEYFNEAAASGMAPEGVVTRWTLTTEIMQPEGSRAFASISSDANGQKLMSWDAMGMHMLSIIKTARDALKAWR